MLMRNFGYQFQVVIKVTIMGHRLNLSRVEGEPEE
jgi:hypothetical protein